MFYEKSTNFNNALINQIIKLKKYGKILTNYSESCKIISRENFPNNKFLIRKG